MTVLSHAHEGKDLIAVFGDTSYARFPVKTKRIDVGEDIVSLVKGELTDVVENGDLVFIAESVVAISQGRAYKFDEIEYGFWAEKLAQFVTKTPAGIGLGTPETMQLAINEVGICRILLASFVAAISKPLGIKGNFYRIAGERVRAIDGPTAGTLPPYNGYATLSPEDPRSIAIEIERALLPKEVEVVIIDANDIGVNILGARNRDQEQLAMALCADNPLGQGSEQTPILLCRKQ